MCRVSMRDSTVTKKYEKTTKTPYISTTNELKKHSKK